MKLAVACDKPERTCRVSSKAGRSLFYFIFEDGDLIDTWKNEYSGNVSRSGKKVAEELSKRNIDRVVSGGFGPVTREMLETFDIYYIEVEDITVEKAVDRHGN